MTTANVLLWGNRVGTVAWDGPGRTGVFEYDAGFADSGIEIAPMKMPLGRKPYSFPHLDPDTYRGLPGLLADSLPDAFGNALIDAWLKGQGDLQRDFTPVDRLCYIGRRGMGALEFEPALVDDSAQHRVEVEQLLDLANSVQAVDNMDILKDNDARMQLLRRLFMHEAISDKLHEIADICRRHEVESLVVYGSAARGHDFDLETSDADFLIEFKPNSDCDNTCVRHFNLMDELGDALGRPVDLAYPETIENPYMRRSIYACTEVVYDWLKDMENPDHEKREHRTSRVAVGH